MKYYNIITEIIINDSISKWNDNNNNISFLYFQNNLGNGEQKSNYNSYHKHINSYSHLPKSNSNSSISFQLYDYNKSAIAKSERIPLKNKFQKNNLKKNNSKNYLNNINSFEHIDKVKQDSFLSNLNYNINHNMKRFKNKRTLSHGHINLKMNRDNRDNAIYNILNKENINNNSNNSYIYNNSNMMNNIHSLKGVFPSYSINTPNGIICPIIVANNNDNFINNNNMNNNILYNYRDHTPINYNFPRKNYSKPSLCYANFFSPINQVPIIQESSYILQIPNYVNNNSTYNSIKNINNNYTKDFLNKQIYDFINANSKTKKNIISNIKRKHSCKLNKSYGVIKVNDKNNISKQSLKRKNNSFYTMNIDESNQLINDKINNEKFEYVSDYKDKTTKNNIRNTSKLFNCKETNDISEGIYKNENSTPSSILISKSKNKKRQIPFENRKTKIRTRKKKKR